MFGWFREFPSSVQENGTPFSRNSQPHKLRGFNMRAQGYADSYQTCSLLPQLLPQAPKFSLLKKCRCHLSPVRSIQTFYKAFVSQKDCGPAHTTACICAMPLHKNEPFEDSQWKSFISAMNLVFTPPIHMTPRFMIFWRKERAQQLGAYIFHVLGQEFEYSTVCHPTVLPFVVLESQKYN